MATAAASTFRRRSSESRPSCGGSAARSPTCGPAFAEAQQTVAALQLERHELAHASTQARTECAELRTALEREREQFQNELGSGRRELDRTREESRASAARCGNAETALSELEDRLGRQGVVLVEVCSS